MYNYRCLIESVVDGDTVHAMVDLGFDQYKRMTIRLAGINAPEMSTDAGILAKIHLVELVCQWDFSGPFQTNETLVAYKWLNLNTIKDHKEKYGRYLGTLFNGDYSVNLNEQMIDDGHAVPYMVEK